MRAVLTLAVLALATAAPVCGLAGQVVLAHFDDLPIESGVGDHYPGLVLAAGVRPYDWARSAPNAAYTDTYNTFRFPSGAVWVSFYGASIGSIRVYGMDGAQLAFVQPQTQGYDPWAHVDLRYGQPIGWLKVLGTAPWPHYYVDDLSYEIVPEPSSLAALALGLLAAGVGLRRRRV